MLQYWSHMQIIAPAVAIGPPCQNVSWNPDRICIEAGSSGLKTLQSLALRKAWSSKGLAIPCCLSSSARFLDWQKACGRQPHQCSSYATGSTGSEGSPAGSSARWRCASPSSFSVGSFWHLAPFFGALGGLGAAIVQGCPASKKSSPSSLPAPNRTEHSNAARLSEALKGPKQGKRRTPAGPISHWQNLCLGAEGWDGNVKTSCLSTTQLEPFLLCTPVSRRSCGPTHQPLLAPCS